MNTKLPFDEDVRKLLLEAMGRLINLKKTTPRLRLRQNLKGRREILDRLISERYLIERDRENYVPGIMAFETCGDDFLLGLAKDGAAIVLRTLQHLYLTESPKTSFTLQEVKEHAKRLSPFVEEEKVEIGLSVVAELDNKQLAGWVPEDGLIRSVVVREDIIDFADVDEFWSQAVRDRLSASSRAEKPVQDNRRRDPLLQILDREAFDRDVDRLCAVATQEKPTALIMIDIDDFKEINDTCGHPAGDEVLQKVASILRSSADGKGDAYRYGGDESAVLLANFCLEEAGALAERIRATVGQTEFEKYPREVTVSLGVATQADGLGDPSSLIKRADDNLLLAKKEGKNRVSTGRDDLIGKPR